MPLCKDLVYTYHCKKLLHFDKPCGLSQWRVIKEPLLKCDDKYVYGVLMYMLLLNDINTALVMYVITPVKKVL